MLYNVMVVSVRDDNSVTIINMYMSPRLESSPPPIPSFLVVMWEILKLLNQSLLLYVTYYSEGKGLNHRTPSKINIFSTTDFPGDVSIDSSCYICSIDLEPQISQIAFTKHSKKCEGFHSMAHCYKNEAT